MSPAWQAEESRVSGRLKLGQILVNRGLLKPDHLAMALADQQSTGARLGMTLVRLGFVDEETLIRTLAGQLKLPVARIRGKRVGPEVLACVGVDLAEKHRCLPLFFKREAGERVLFVAMEDPSDGDALEELARESGEIVRPVLVGPTELEEALQRHYHWASLTGEAPEWGVPRPADEAGGAEDPEPDPDRPGAEPGFALGAAEAPQPGFGLAPDPELGADPGGPEPTRHEEPLWAASWVEEDGEADTAPELPGGELPAGELLDADDDAAEPDFELAAPDPAPQPPAPQVARPDSLDPRIILRALSQLLVEKGVITRDEFVQRLGELAAREGVRVD
jgi:type IV pilus assembly protein PilB